jgi:hypothetical protein
MRAYTLIAMLSVTAGCSGAGDWQGGVPTAPEETQIGQTRQAAQFADATVMNLVDTGDTRLTVTADGDPVTVQIYYIGDKTTNAGHFPATAVLIDTLSLATDQTVVHDVNMGHPAFAGGYGSLLVDAIGASPTNVFQTYAEYDEAIYSVGGSVFQGTSYRVPYTSNTKKVVLALTNQSDFQYDILIANVGGIESKTITLVPLTTFRFDSLAEGWALLGTTSSIQIFTQASGTVAVSGYEVRRRHPNKKIRINPVKAAAFL